MATTLTVKQLQEPWEISKHRWATQDPYILQLEESCSTIRSQAIMYTKGANTHARRVRQCPTLIYTHEPIICYFAKDITCSVPAVVVNEALVLALIVLNTIIRRRLSRAGLLCFATSLFRGLLLTQLDSHLSFFFLAPFAVSQVSFPLVRRAFVLKQTSLTACQASCYMRNCGATQFCRRGTI